MNNIIKKLGIRKIKIPYTNLLVNKSNLHCVVFSHGIWKHFKRCRQCGGKLEIDKKLPYEYEIGEKWGNKVCIKCGNVSTEKVGIRQ